MSSTTAAARGDRSVDGRGGGWTRSTLVIVVTWVVLCALVVGWGWLLTNPLKSSINPWDNEVSRWFADQRNAGLTRWADAGTFIGETVVGASLFTIVGVLVSLVARTWRPILLVAVVEAGLGGFYFVATELVPRERPPVRILDAGLVPDASFPSGHVATALVCWAGTVLLVWTYLRAVRWPALVLLLLPLGTFLARLYEGAHHLTDALTSVVYASIWLLVVAGQVLPGSPVSRSVSTSDAPTSSGR
jgi:membrane-associated phospholipid phosphatase